MLCFFLGQIQGTICPLIQCCLHYSSYTGYISTRRLMIHGSNVGTDNGVPKCWCSCIFGERSYSSCFDLKKNFPNVSYQPNMKEILPVVLGILGKLNSSFYIVKYDGSRSDSSLLHAGKWWFSYTFLEIMDPWQFHISYFKKRSVGLCCKADNIYILHS